MINHIIYITHIFFTIGGGRMSFTTNRERTQYLKCIEYLERMRRSRFISDTTWNEINERINKMHNVDELTRLTQAISKELLLRNGCCTLGQLIYG